jgi:predicted phosphodiesterase
LRLSREEAVAEGLTLAEAMSIQTVARQMSREYPEYFKDTDAARSALRYRLGSNGDAKRKLAGITEPKLSTIAEGLEKRATWRESMASAPEEPLQYSEGRYLILSDIHIPYHDVEALETALSYGDQYDPDVIILNGDLLDFYQCSRFSKDPRKVAIYRELEIANDFLDHLAERYPDATFAFKYGNHEQRLDDYIKTNAAAINGMKGLSVEEQLDFEDRGIKWRRSAWIYLGKLTIGHGHERKTPFGSKHPHQRNGDWAKDSYLTGHHHKVGEDVRVSIRGKIMGSWTTGCLCYLNPEYNPHSAVDGCIHGFATVEVDEHGDFTVKNHRIIEGVIR